MADRPIKPWTDCPDERNVTKRIVVQHRSAIRISSRRSLTLDPGGLLTALRALGPTCLLYGMCVVNLSTE